MASIGGGGSTKISNMDDVDISAQQNGFALKYNSSTGKYDFGEVASDSICFNESRYCARR